MKKLLTALLILHTIHSFAQLPVGSWRDHLPYKTTQVVVQGDNKIYCATGQAIFYYDMADESINRLTKINILSDTDIGSISYSQNHKTLIVGYNNGNIDLIKEDHKTNIPDVKLKNIIADKSINHIYVNDDFAYLSTGFGIIVINLIKEEIADTYIVGDQGSFVNILQTQVVNDTIYALTERDLYVANYNNPFLANFENWHIDTSMSFYGDKLISATVFNKQLMLIHTPDSSSLGYLHKLENNQWINTNVAQYYSQKINADNENILFIGRYEIKTYDRSFNLISKFKIPNYNDAVYISGNIWAANSTKGLVKLNDAGEESFFSPDGPASINSFFLYSNNGQILVAPGGYETTGENLYSPADVYSFNDETWSVVSEHDNMDLDKMRDVVTFTSNANNGRYMAGTWGFGIFEVSNNKIVKTYNSENTGGILGDSVGGMTYDREGNLWVVCRNSNYPFVVKTPDNKWYRYNYDDHWNKTQTYKVVEAQNGDLWTICFNSATTRKDIYVWNCNGTPENESDDTYNNFILVDENSNSISSSLNDIEVDLDGLVWLATNDGVAVYDNPENATDRSISHYARRPQLVIDGYLKNLLEGESVTSIAIDGANRKWFGTFGGGVFLVSSDGTKQIINWNTSNSKLFSNNITDITINHNTGEVFIATDQGIQSYMGTSTGNQSDYSSIYAFPNPVRKDYNGYITIRGLMYQTDVKITDLSGRLVFSTTSNGGDALWNGKDLTGNPVSSGIYLVLCTNPDGSEAEATKILFVK